MLGCHSNKRLMTRGSECFVRPQTESEAGPQDWNMSRAQRKMACTSAGSTALNQLTNTHPTHTHMLTHASCILWNEAFERKKCSVHIQKNDSWFPDSSGERRFAHGNHTVSSLCHCLRRNLQHLLGHVRASLWRFSAGAAVFLLMTEKLWGARGACVLDS